MQITPEQLAKPNTEHAHQSALFCWAALNYQTYPQLRLMFAIPNGGQRGDGSERGATIAGGRFKAEGVKKGVHDIFLPYVQEMIGSMMGFAGLFIEMKKPTERTRKNGGMSDEQIEFAAGVTAAGYLAVTCHSWIEARNAIMAYIDGRVI